jgi:aldehyde:ferredoxin oxidoreductase
MAFGFNDRVAVVDLSRGNVQLESPGEDFYRTYLGGSALALVYLHELMPTGAEPLGPENVLVFAPSVLTGAPLVGLSRFNVSAKSPLTGAVGDSQAGGAWGPALKAAGLDALVVTGRSEEPVYLLCREEAVEIRPAAHLAPLFAKELEKTLRAELAREAPLAAGRYEILQNGPAGRRLVRFASVSTGLHHHAGRTGMGAVMGSKNLVAVAAGGRRSYSFADEAALNELARTSRRKGKESGTGRFLRELGTAGTVAAMQGLGALPTRNMSAGVFSQAEQISGEWLRDNLLVGRGSCAGCTVACKRVVASEGSPAVDPAYGGPEYETIAMLGSNAGIGDLTAVAKANELCNAYGLDTIQTGAMVAFAMECAEAGSIPGDLLGGLKLRFGAAEAALELIRLIGERQGLGDLLAEGFPDAVAAFGPESAPCAVHVKGNAIPAHMPQVKKSQALAYAVNAFGADHVSSEHDGLLKRGGPELLALGIGEQRPWEALDEMKARYVAYTSWYYSLLDTLELCTFCWAPGSMHTYDELVDAVRAVTGWPVTFWSLMKAGERRLNLMRAFNARHGIGLEADVLPERVFVPLSEGPQEGQAVPREDLERARAAYYSVVGWDPESGAPTAGKLLDLGLGWLEALEG